MEGLLMLENDPSWVERKKLLVDAAKDAIAALVEITKNGNIDPQTRIRAAEIILSRV